MDGVKRRMVETLLLWFSVGICFCLVTEGIGCRGLDNQGSDEGSEPDFKFVKVPDPLSGNNPVFRLVSKDEPEIGKSFKDHHFKTTLTRVTGRGKIRHEYARFDPFNRDQSLIILRDTDSGDFIVYRTKELPYEQASNRVRVLNNLEESRWDPNDPQKVWGQRDFSIVILNVVSGEETVAKDFSKDPIIKPILSAEPDLYRITMRDEGESSVDKRYWCFMLQGSKDDYRGRYLITWDRVQDKILGFYKLSKAESEIDWVGMSPLGNYALIGADSTNGGNLVGFTLANLELTRFHQLDYATGHSDVGLDTDGNEVIVMQNSRTDHIDLIPLDWKTKPIPESVGGYQGTNRVPLVRLFYSSESNMGFSAGVHISCNVPGYCVVSTYMEPRIPEKNWLDRCNIIIKLDRNQPKAYYLSKVYNTCGAYWEETQATIANDGSKIVWSSNWNKDVGKERGFVIQLDMPPNWKDLD